MATAPDDVRFQGKTGSSQPTTKMTRLTRSRLRSAPMLGAQNSFAEGVDWNTISPNILVDE